MKLTARTSGFKLRKWWMRNVSSFVILFLVNNSLHLSKEASKSNPPYLYSWVSLSWGSKFSTPHWAVRTATKWLSPHLQCNATTALALHISPNHLLSEAADQLASKRFLDMIMVEIMIPRNGENKVKITARTRGFRLRKWCGMQVVLWFYSS